MKKNKREEITLHGYCQVEVTRGDGLRSVRGFYGAYDLILELGGNLGDVLDISIALNNGEVVRFGSLRVRMI